MVYRDYLFTQDKKFLRELYPKAKKALKWILATDKNKDFLPDDAGQDQTFDLWPFYGVSSYVGSIFLASLLAMQKMAQILDDRQTEEFCRIYFPWARESFSDKLWQKNYFICYRSENKKSLACTVGQLTGQWYAHLLDLGYIIEPKKVRAAIQKIFSFNAQDSQFGATNSLFLNKKKDSVCRQSENIFLGITYAFSSLAIYEGFSKEALKLARKTWENLVKLQKNPWNQPDMVSSKTGKYLFGDHYMRNLGIFSLLLALKKAQKIKAL
jgi:uncharacterized protein (DUF608 family)